MRRNMVSFIWPWMLWARPSPEADFRVAGASGGIFRLAGVGAISIAGLLLRLRRRSVAVRQCLRSVPTSPVVPTLSQPPEEVGDTKSRSKTTVSPTSPCGPNLLLHIHVGERKRSGTCFLYERRGPRWGHRGWDHIRSSHCSKTIKDCPNPLKFGPALGSWDRDGQRVDLRRPRRAWSFSLWPRAANATSCGDQSRRPTACEPSR